MDEKQINIMELDVYTTTIIKHKIKKNASIFFLVIDLCEVNENYYKT